MKETHVIVVCAVLLSMVNGCSHVPTAQQTNYEANITYYDQRYDGALIKYRQALDLAIKSGDKQYEAIAMFGLARTNAQLCRQSEAEKWFKESIAKREAIPDTEHAHLTQNFLEYGRFLKTQSRLKEAVVFYDRAMPILVSLNMEQRDPLGYAYIFDEYEELLQTVGRKVEAVKASARASSLRTSNKGKAAKFTPEPYRNCSK